MYVVSHQDGSRWFRDVPPICVDTLKQMFEWIDSDDPRVRKRIYPDTFADPAEEAAWRRLMGSELEHLVQSRREIVEQDLARLRLDDTGFYRFPVGKGHDGAWLSTLTAARLALFELHGLSPHDMDVDLEDDVPDTKAVALLRIDLLGLLQELLLQGR